MILSITATSEYIRPAASVLNGPVKRAVPGETACYLKEEATKLASNNTLIKKLCKIVILLNAND